MKIIFEHKDKKIYFDPVRFLINRYTAQVFAVLIVFFLLNHAEATTPSPGHSWSEVGNGFWQATNAQTAMRSFGFPDQDATVVTSLGPVMSGAVLYGNGTGIAATTSAATPGYVLASLSGIPTWAPTTTLANISGTLGLTKGGTGNSLSASNGGIVYSDASVLQVLAGTATANKLLVSGASGAPSWSTPTFPNASATARKIIVSDGTNWTASTETYATPGTSGNIMQSDGTNWKSATSSDPVFFTPHGLHAANLTAVTAITSTNSYFEYIGVAAKPYTTCTVLQNVTTAAATITWAEVAIFRGTPVLNGNASLTRLGYTSVSGTYNSTGRKSTAVTLTGAFTGDNLWVAWGSQATTAFQVRGMLADDLQSGVFQTATIRPSLASSPQATTLGGATAVPGWVMVKCT